VTIPAHTSADVVDYKNEVKPGGPQMKPGGDHKWRPSHTTNGVCRTTKETQSTAKRNLINYKTKSSQLQTKSNGITIRVLVLILKPAARPSQFTQGTTLVVPNIYVLIL